MFLGVFLFVLLGIGIAIGLDTALDSNDRICICTALGTSVLVTLAGISKLRGKSIVLNDEGIGYYAPTKVIDRDRKTNVDHILLNWADIEYLSATPTGYAFFLHCHMADGRIVVLTPSEIAPNPSLHFFERHYTFSKEHRR